MSLFGLKLQEIKIINDLRTPFHFKDTEGRIDDEKNTICYRMVRFKIDQSVFWSRITVTLVGALPKRYPNLIIVKKKKLKKNKNPMINDFCRELKRRNILKIKCGQMSTFKIGIVL